MNYFLKFIKNFNSIDMVLLYANPYDYQIKGLSLDILKKWYNKFGFSELILDKKTNIEYEDNYMYLVI